MDSSKMMGNLPEVLQLQPAHLQLAVGVLPIIDLALNYRLDFYTKLIRKFGKSDDFMSYRSSGKQ